MGLRLRLFLLATSFKPAIVLMYVLLVKVGLHTQVMRYFKKGRSRSGGYAEFLPDRRQKATESTLFRMGFVWFS